MILKMRYAPLSPRAGAWQLLWYADPIQIYYTWPPPIIRGADYKAVYA